MGYCKRRCHEESVRDILSRRIRELDFERDLKNGLLEYRKNCDHYNNHAFNNTGISNPYPISNSIFNPFYGQYPFTGESKYFRNLSKNTYNTTPSIRKWSENYRINNQGIDSSFNYGSHVTTGRSSSYSNLYNLSGSSNQKQLKMPASLKPLTQGVDVDFKRYTGLNPNALSFQNLVDFKLMNRTIGELSPIWGDKIKPIYDGWFPYPTGYKLTADLKKKITFGEAERQGFKGYNMY